MVPNDWLELTTLPDVTLSYVTINKTCNVNIQARSCNHCCCGRAESYYNLRVCILGRSGEQIRKTWKVLKCGVGEMSRKSVGEVLHSVKGGRSTLVQQKEVQLDWSHLA